MEKKRIVILVVAILAGLFIVYILTGGNFGISGKTITESESNLMVTCEETDGGDNPNVKGNVTQIYLKDTPYRKKGSIYFYDSCGYGNTLTEYYCSTKNYAGTKVYHCENGCKDSACISSESTQEEKQETEAVLVPEETATSEKSSSIFTRVIDFFKKIFS